MNLKVVLKNTNKKKYVQNMTVTVGCEGDGISLGNTANTQYYEKLGAGKTLDEAFGLIETVEKAAQLYMLTEGKERINILNDDDLRALAKQFDLNYRKDFLE